jgi:hypothetical protein
MFFDILSNILFFKKKNCFKVEEDEKHFSPFIINRWVSMYSPSLAKQANITNKYLGIFETKYQAYTFFLSFFDKVQSKKINYIKRKKEDNSNNEQNDITLQLSKNFEISSREIRNYINVLNS